MRQNELIYGIDIQDENGNNVGKSRVAAAKGISQVSNVYALCEMFSNTVQSTKDFMITLDCYSKYNE